MYYFAAEATGNQKAVVIPCPALTGTHTHTYDRNMLCYICSSLHHTHTRTLTHTHTHTHEALCASLTPTSSSVTALDLSSNGIDQRGAFALANMLTQHGCALQHLVLTDNPVGMRGGQRIVDALKYNSSLTHFRWAGGYVCVCDVFVFF